MFCVCACACACDYSESLSTCDTVLCHILNDRNTPLEQAAGYEPRTKGKEPRANRNVKIKTVSAEPLAVRTHPQEDGLGTRSKSGTP